MLRFNQIYRGTYNSTIVFNYEIFHDTWTPIYVENALTRYKPCYPTNVPTKRPTRRPSNIPSVVPSKAPSTRPTARPTNFPSLRPSGIPSANPTAAPSVIPTLQPSAKPSDEPTDKPTARPTRPPTISPTVFPSEVPSVRPSNSPSFIPSKNPTAEPTNSPSLSSKFVEVTLHATGGALDSWTKGVYFYIYGPDKTFSEGSLLLMDSGPYSYHNPKVVRFQPAYSGTYNFVVQFDSRFIDDDTFAYELKCQVIY